MLDPGQDEPARDALAQDARGRIEKAGTLKDENKWGLRKLAYEIAQRNEADYRWFRFEGPSELLDDLNHNLKIADGVLRFRIFKVDASTPTMAPPAVSSPGPASRERIAQSAHRAEGDEIDAEDVDEAPAEPPEPADEPAPAE